MSIFTEGKDKIISKGLKTFANIIINDYGKITDFAANTKNKTITLNVLLKGEKEDLQITFSNYSVISDDKNTYFQFDSIRTTREWLNILFEKKLSIRTAENLTGINHSIIESKSKEIAKTILSYYKN